MEDELEGQINTPAVKDVKLPPWQKEFDQTDHNHFLKLAQERTNRDLLYSTLDNIAFRLEGAELGNTLPSEEHPTFIARSEFINVAHAFPHVLGRINALRELTSQYGKMTEGKNVLKQRVARLEQTEGENEDDIVFSSSVEFKKARVTVKMQKNQKAAVEIDYPPDFFEGQTPSYRSGFLEAENLTNEEVEVLMRNNLEVSFYNLYGDPNKSSYPWEEPAV